MKNYGFVLPLLNKFIGSFYFLILIFYSFVFFIGLSDLLYFNIFKESSNFSLFSVYFLSSKILNCSNSPNKLS